MKVAGRVAAAVEVTPARVVLPLASGTGRLDEVTCQVFSPFGEAVTFVSIDAPPGLTVTQQHASDKNCLLRVKQVPKPDRQTHIVRLNVRVGARNVTVELPVVSLGDGET